MQPIMDIAALDAFIEAEFPQVNADGPDYSIVAVGPGEAIVRLDPAERHLRPGGTISGPTLFALADLCAYVAILAHIGPVALAVTTSMSIDFMRKPRLEPIEARGRILKLGKRLAVIEIAIGHSTAEAMLAHATATYSIPPLHGVVL